MHLSRTRTLAILVILIEIVAIASIPCCVSAATKRTVLPRVIAVPILTYHYIRPLDGLDASGRSLSVSPVHFEMQMEQLVLQGYHAITPAQLDAALTNGDPLPSKPIMITFDDGYYDQFQNALPVLVRLHLPATMFIVSGFLNRYGYMYESTVRAADATGLITIGAHTQHHMNLTTISTLRAHNEILGSKADLERILNHPITAFAYPFGSYSTPLLREVAADGFHLAFTTVNGDRQSSQIRYQLERSHVRDAPTISWLSR